MPHFVLDRDACPCGSSRVIAECCMRPCGSLRPKPPPTGFAHPKCYAAALRDCSRDLSKEHFVSASVLRALSSLGPILAKGFAWQPKGVGKHLSPDALGSRVLCKRHNNTLHRLDDVAARLFSSLPRMEDDQILAASDVALFYGPDVERCLLKVLCGTVAAGATTAMSEVKAAGWRPSQELLSVLFDGRALAAPCGLYLPARPGDELRDGVEVTPVWEQRRIQDQIVRSIVGLRMGLRGFRFVLIAEKPASLESSIMSDYRPAEITFLGPAGEKKILGLYWGDGRRHAVQLEWHRDLHI